jgi:hypothetical protein
MEIGGDGRRTADFLHAFVISAVADRQLRAVGLFADDGVAAALLRSILVLSLTFMQAPKAGTPAKGDNKPCFRKRRWR